MSDITSTSNTINILWIRHSFSIANLLKETDPWYIINGTILCPDARLTEIGKDQAFITGSQIIHDLSKEYNIVPFMFTSILSRTMQTAHFLSEGLVNYFNYDKWPLVILPHIEEVPLSKYLPIDQQNQPRNINVIKSDKDLFFMKFHNIPGLTPYDKYGNPKDRVNIPKFYKDTLPKIISFLDITSKNKNILIVVISHRQTIEQATGHSLGNVGAVLQNVEYNRKLGSSAKIIKKKSRVIFNGYTKKDSVDEIYIADS